MQTITGIGTTTQRLYASIELSDDVLSWVAHVVPAFVAFGRAFGEASGALSQKVELDWLEDRVGITVDGVNAGSIPVPPIEG